MTEKLQDMENEAMSKIVELEKQLMQRNKDLEILRVRAGLFQYYLFDPYLCILSTAETDELTNISASSPDNRTSTKTPAHRSTLCGWCWRRRTKPSRGRVTWRRRSTSWRNREPSRSTRRRTETSPSWPRRQEESKVFQQELWLEEQSDLSVQTTLELWRACLLLLLHHLLLHCQSTAHVRLSYELWISLLTMKTYMYVCLHTVYSYSYLYVYTRHSWATVYSPTIDCIFFIITSSTSSKWVKDEQEMWNLILKKCH